jgi:hypothetical protein
MLVRVMKHLGPGGGMETIAVAVMTNKIVPSWFMQRIDDSHLQSSAIVMSLPPEQIRR